MCQVMTIRQQSRVSRKTMKMRTTLTSWYLSMTLRSLSSENYNWRSVTTRRHSRNKSFKKLRLSNKSTTWRSQMKTQKLTKPVVWSILIDWRMSFARLISTLWRTSRQIVTLTAQTLKTSVALLTVTCGDPSRNSSHQILGSWLFRCMLRKIWPSMQLTLSIRLRTIGEWTQRQCSVRLASRCITITVRLAKEVSSRRMRRRSENIGSSHTFKRGTLGRILLSFTCQFYQIMLMSRMDAFPYLKLAWRSCNSLSRKQRKVVVQAVSSGRKNRHTRSLPRTSCTAKSHLRTLYPANLHRWVRSRRNRPEILAKTSVWSNNTRLKRWNSSHVWLNIARASSVW